MEVVPPPPPPPPPPQSIFSVRDNSVEFDEETHTYHVNGIKVPLSVTGLVGTLYNTFDRMAVANNCVRYRPGTASLKFSDRVNYVLSEFNFAALMGTLIHKKIENSFMDKPEPVEFISHKYEPGLSNDGRLLFDREYTAFKSNEIIEKKFTNYLKFKQVISKHWDFAAAEFIVWSDNMNGHLLAGCIDAIYWSDREKREIIIVDWKTNKNLHNSRRETTKISDSPMLHDKNDTLDKYFCQMHMYTRILEAHYNVTVVAQLIVHLSETTFTIYNATSHKTCKCNLFSK